jgi:uncharacterized protein YcbK (DUF882 family)
MTSSTKKGVRAFSKKDETRLSPNFKVSEFKCPCDECKETLVDLGMIARLEKMRSILGSRLHVDSGYRCANYQEQLRLRGFETSKGPSTHQLGQAADVSNGVTPGMELEDAARKAGFESVGVGSRFVHVDMRPGYRRWTYKS